MNNMPGQTACNANEPPGIYLQFGLVIYHYNTVPADVNQQQIKAPTLAQA